MKPMPKMYRVIFHDNGSAHILDKEPMEGITEWAKGQNVTVYEYAFSGIPYSRLPKSEPEPKPGAGALAAKL